MRYLRRLSLPLLALALAGCDPVGSVGAVIVDLGKAPVAGATVRFSCPPNSSVNGASVTTGPDGKFTYDHIPEIPASCTMTVEKTGFLPKKLTTKDVLYQNGMLTGKETLPTVQLDPAPPMPGAVPAAP